MWISFLCFGCRSNRILHVYGRTVTEPIEEWMTASEKVRQLVEDLEAHAVNSIDYCHHGGLDSYDFKRLCAISLRQFLEGLTKESKGS